MEDKTLLTLKINDVAETEENLWILHCENNVLARYNKKIKSIDYITWIPGGSMQTDLYSKLIRYRQYLILAPYAASEALIFDTEQFRFERLQLPELPERFPYRKHAKFSNGVCKGHCIYLIPGEYPGIVCIDMEEKKAKMAQEWLSLYIKELWSRPPQEVYGVSIEAYAGMDQCDMYMSFCGDEKGKIGRFSFEACDMDLYTIAGVDSYFSCMEYDEENLYLVSRAGEVICWDKKSRKVRYKHSLGLEFDKNDKDYCSCGIIGESILYNQKLYLFLLDVPQYIEFDLKNQSMEHHAFRQIKEAVKKAYLSEEGAYLITKGKGGLYRYGDSGVERFPLYKEKSLMYGAYVDGVWNRAYSVKEGDILNLEESLDLLTNSKNERKNHPGLNIGKQIHYAIKEIE